MKLKKLAAVSLALSMAVATYVVPASALKYGEEWEGSSTTYTKKYSDVPPSHWAYENIMYVSEKGWFNGYEDGRFAPNDRITRAQAMTVLVKVLDLELQDVTESSYYDINVDKDWYAPYVEAGKGLLPERVSIQGKIPFQPNKPITREDAMYAIVVALGYSDEVKFVDESCLNMFKDQNSISSNVRPYIAYGVSNQLISGRDNGTIGGQDPLSRAEFATLLYRASKMGFHATATPKLQSISVSPSGLQEMQIGESFTISATAHYTDGSTESYKNIGAYNASDNGVVTINKNQVTAVKAGNCEIKFEDKNLKNSSIIIAVEKKIGHLSLRLNNVENSTYEEYMTISGSATDSEKGKITLTCNGKNIALNSNGEFSHIVKLSVGSNNYELVATNDSGSSASKSVTIQRKERGLVSLNLDNYDSATFKEKMTLSGKVNDSANEKVSLTCNGKNVSVNQDGTFSHSVNLKIGSNTFDFEAKNGSGNSVSKSAVIVRKEPGRVSISFDSYDSSTEEESMAITGKIMDSANGSITLTCNGKDVAVDTSNDGSFSVLVDLEIGTNNFEFIAKNDSGGSITKSIRIERIEKAEDDELTVKPGDSLSSNIEDELFVLK